MTRIQKDQSSNPARILTMPTPTQSNMSAAPAAPSRVPTHVFDPNNKKTSSEEQADQHSDRPQQTLCPSARLRIHLDDIAHPAIDKVTKIIPLSSLLAGAIRNVQTHLFTPVDQSFASTPTNIPPPQKPLPPKEVVWHPQEVRSITLILRPMEGVAYTTGTELDEAHKEIHLSLDYLLARIKQFYGKDHVDTCSERGDKSFIHEVRGVVTHEMVHAFQHNARSTCPGGLVEGIADYVRLKSQLGAEHWNPWPAGSRTRGEKWDEGYQKSAWFLEWVEDNVGGSGAIGKLNEAMRKQEWENGQVWTKVIGKSVKECWDLYQDDWEKMNKKHEDES